MNIKCSVGGCEKSYTNSENAKVFWLAVVNTAMNLLSFTQVVSLTERLSASEEGNYIKKLVTQVVQKEQS
jgi:hypothetical protein